MHDSQAVHPQMHSVMFMHYCCWQKYAVTIPADTYDVTGICVSKKMSTLFYWPEPPEHLQHTIIDEQQWHVFILL